MPSTAVAETPSPVRTEYELERGKPLPSKNHGIVQFRLSLALGPYADVFTIIPELSLELEGESFVPDISVFSKLPIDWRHDEARLTDPPLLVVEILSPSQAFDPLVGRAETYFTAGVKSCWLVQPVLETIAVLTPAEKVRFYTSGEVVDPATGIKVAIEKIFR